VCVASVNGNDMISYELVAVVKPMLAYYPSVLYRKRDVTDQIGLLLVSFTDVSVDRNPEDIL